MDFPNDSVDPKLGMELYVIRWLIIKIITDMTTDHWFEISEKNDDKWYIINIQIKYTIIIIVHSTNFGIFYGTF